MSLITGSSMQTEQETLALTVQEPSSDAEGGAAQRALEAPVLPVSEPVVLSEPGEEKLEDPAAERRRIEEQLLALKRREAELRRALATASHPQLADAIRLIEGRAYALSRADAKLAQGLSKSEERRRGTLEKKRASLVEKRAELDAQIAELDSELNALGSERTDAFNRERRTAMEELIAALGEHGAALQEAGLEASQLVPEIAAWLPEIEATAQRLASRAN